MEGGTPRVAVGVCAEKKGGGYAEGHPRRIPNAVTAPSRPGVPGTRVHHLRRRPRYAEGSHRRSLAYAEGTATPTAILAGWPSQVVRRRSRPLAVGVSAGRRRNAPFL